MTIVYRVYNSNTTSSTNIIFIHKEWYWLNCIYGIHVPDQEFPKSAAHVCVVFELCTTYFDGIRVPVLQFQYT